MDKYPLKKGWTFTKIEGLRDVPGFGTYFLFDFHELAPLNFELDEHFNWMRDFPVRREEEDDYAFEEQLEVLEKEASEKGLRMPLSFRVFMREEGLMRKIRSNTDCYFELGDMIEEIPQSGGLHVIHFLSDSQSCCFWYLGLDREGNQMVLSSANLYGHRSEGEIFGEPTGDRGHICANSFEEFIFRFWIENEIWYKFCYQKEALNEIEQKYVDHLKSTYEAT